MGAMAVAKAAQETAILTAMKRQLEALEEKLQSQIQRVQQHGDRVREAALSRVDAKVGIMEALQPKLDRRLAELSGNYKGLSDEMQAQIRRIDQMDSRFWDWRHQLEEEVRSRFVDLENAQKESDSAIRLASATNEDALKRVSSRLRRLETLVEERMGYYDDVNQSLAGLDARMQEMEASRIQDLALSSVDALSASRALAPPDLGASDCAASTALVEARVAEALARVDSADRDFKELQVRVEAQEERMRSFRTLLDSKEETYRAAKFDRQDWEARARELHEAQQELDKHRLQHREQLEVLGRRLGQHDEAHEEVCLQLRRLQDRGVVAPADLDGAGAGADGDGAADAAEEEWAVRLEALEERVEALNVDLQTVRADAELAPRVAALVESLSQVAPKVVQHDRATKELQEKLGNLEAVTDRSVKSLHDRFGLWEAKAALAEATAKSVRELHEKLGQLETKAAMSPALSPGRTGDAMATRVNQLELEVGRLRSEIEGSELPPTLAAQGHAGDAL